MEFSVLNVNLITIITIWMTANKNHCQNTMLKCCTLHLILGSSSL